MDQVESVPDGAAQPVEGVDDDDITRAGLLKGLLESGAIGGGSGFLVDVDVLVLLQTRVFDENPGSGTSCGAR